MNTTTITVTPETKTKAQAIAKRLGMSLSEVVEHSLKQFVQTNAKQPSDLEEIPNAATRKSLEQSEADIKAGRTISFASGKEALEYLDKEILKRKRKRETH